MAERSIHTTRAPGRTVRSLNGVWQLGPGTREHPPTLWTLRTSVPGLIDLTDPLHNWMVSDYHWYRTTFDREALPPNSVVILRLNQSRFGTAVRLNDVCVGEGISCYTGQEYRIDPHLRPGTPNELLVRVGAKSTLPPESAVGNDQEMTRFIPGIWGDVSLQATGMVRIANVQVLPHLSPAYAEARVTIENFGPSRATVSLGGMVEVSATRKVVCAALSSEVQADPGRSRVTMRFPMEGASLWSPGSPVLHTLNMTASVGGTLSDRVSVRFGQREFRVDGRHLLLNGARIRLRGGNIAFHRFLADPQRDLLPWDRSWIRRVLAEIPKAHHFNFFRAHIGPMYDAWYDIADEEGMLIQNEWPFWRASGTKEQIVREWTDWILESGNHPSIIVWDAVNECSEPMVEQEIVPLMKELDPTRPWEPADVRDQHPYIYSLGPVLNERRLGFTLGIGELERLETPLIVNEFVWWWLNPQNYPTPLMEGVVERWLGHDWTKRDLIAHQSFLAQELVELFRRLDAAAIQPFVYLSNGNGATGNWFDGDVRHAVPKPILVTLKNAFAPVGVSIELWDRHFVPEERRRVRVFVFNDTPVPATAHLTVDIRSSTGAVCSTSSRTLALGPISTSIELFDLTFPDVPGVHSVVAELRSATGEGTCAVSRKEALILRPGFPQGQAHAEMVHLFSRDGDFRTFFEERRIRVRSWETPAVGERTVCIVSGRAVESGQFVESLESLGVFVRSGGTMVLCEPEHEIVGRRTILVLPDLEITVAERADAERGGYDSYVHPEQLGHSFWNGLEPRHLRMFNGALGGEAVSAHDVSVRAAHMPLARCGLGLRTLAATEIPYGEGRVILNRIQFRGRLAGAAGSDDLFARRPDPVAQQLALNLLSLA